MISMRADCRRAIRLPRSWRVSPTFATTCAHERERQAGGADSFVAPLTKLSVARGPRSLRHATQCLEGRATRASGIAVRHDLDPRLLLLALRAHPGPEHRHPPGLEFRRDFERAAADQERIRIQQVRD